MVRAINFKSILIQLVEIFIKKDLIILNEKKNVLQWVRSYFIFPLTDVSIISAYIF